MRRLVAVAAVAVVLLAGLVYGQTDTLVVIHINDTHSHLMPFGPKTASGVPKIGGMARAAHVIKELKSAATKSLLLHGGDLMVGDFMYTRFRGVAELRILKELGFGAICVGNHEFDEGPAFLAQAYKDAGLPTDEFAILTANVDMRADTALSRLVRPYTIKDYGTFRVGIFGLTPPMANSFSYPQPDSVTDFVAAARAAIDSLRQKVDILLCLSHLGVDDDQVLAADVSGIDVIVGAHSHTVLEEAIPVVNPAGDTTWIVQAGSHYRYVGTFKLIWQEPKARFAGYHLIRIDENVPEDPEVGGEIAALVDTLKNDPRYGDVYHQVLAEAAVDVERTVGEGRERDTGIGNLITDALRAAAGADVAIDVHGYISEKLWAGPLTGADIFHIAYYGYDPTTGHGLNVVKVGLKGKDIRMGMEYTLRNCKTNGDLTPEVSGMQVLYNSKSFVLMVRELTVNGSPIVPDSVYSVAMTDGLAAFLGSAGLAAEYVEPVGVSEYQALVSWIQAHSPVNYGTEGRIVDVSVTHVSGGRPEAIQDFGLSAGYPNPFNARTVFVYQVPAGRFSLSVFDVRGHLVKHLGGESTTGEFGRLVWDGRDTTGRSVATGVYIVRLEAAGRVATRKVVLVR